MFVVAYSIFILRLRLSDEINLFERQSTIDYEICVDAMTRIALIVQI